LSALALSPQPDLVEVKDIRDKARAIEMYARQAQNTEAERQAIEIRAVGQKRRSIFPSCVASTRLKL
jgi:hypothetical protein